MTIPAVDVRDLMGRPGASRHQPIRGTLDDLGTEVASVRPDRSISGDLLLESILEGILVSGRLTGTLQLRCARCLKEFESGFDLEVHELFTPEPDETADDYPLDPDGTLELEQMVRDAIGVELPFSPLCRPDCLGLCPVCGGDRNLGECPGDHVELDPRWSALDDVLHRLEQS